MGSPGSCSPTAIIRGRRTRCARRRARRPRFTRKIAFYWSERKTLFVGDAVIGNPPGRCALLREQVMDDPARLRQSVRELLALDFDTLLVGDGAPIIQGAKERLRELVEAFPD
ncbi:MAG: hypothetical protein HYU75_20650 [Betaproteobacteria bacterium]|nr:hypothetical protein [Betaproteobacteria bacterium]